MQRLALLLLLGATTWPAQAAAGLDGAALSAGWGLPFAALLLSIAFGPLLAPIFWHRHFGKIVAAWTLAFLLPFAWTFGASLALEMLAHALVAEYLPFILLLAALFTVSGGIYVKGNLHGSPALNTGLLAIGAALASVMGTTGACMLLIRPLLRANDNRQHVAHVVIFFIFIVGNIGGALTPLGDPPLFLGFLKGVDFFWTARHIGLPMLLALALLLALFYAIDSYFFRQRGELGAPDPTPDTRRLGLDGAFNFALLAGIVGLALLSGLWQSRVTLDIFGTPVGLPALARDAGLLLIVALSLWLTPRAVRNANQFDWMPLQEVAKLFAGIFLTIAPVIAMLKAGVDGPFAPMVRAITHAGAATPSPAAYFWATGLLSSLLDNAPTYLVFFNMAGGDAAVLMGAHASALAAISAGAVFMGANTYIGNAPNLMVKAMAENQGVRMPGFFGYMLWSGAILIPLFWLLTALFFA
ncbi:MAG: sodium:proton antiporter [Burkholderiaceae bacterium]|nr:sodium:proton antiporter [Burkholderiaceae bacterium]